MLEMIKVALFWHNYPSENFGVGALTASNIRILSNIYGAANVELVCIGTMPESLDLTQSLGIKTKYFQGSFRLFTKQPNHFFHLIKEIASCDFALDLGEGDSFSDIYGIKRFLLQSIPKLIALKHKVPLVLSPQTIGPFESSLAKIIGRLILNKSKKVFARDSTSYDYARSLLSARANVELEQTSDLAFLLPYQRQETLIGPQTKIGINVSGLLYNGGYSSKNQFLLKDRYQTLIEAIITSLVESPHHSVTLVPHVITDRYPVEDDYRVCRYLAQKFNIYLSPKFGSPSEAKSYISNFDFFLGARMHSTIGAVSSGVATIPLSYSRKFSGLFSAIGYPYLIDLRVSNTAQSIHYIRDHIEASSLLLMRQHAAKASRKAVESLDLYVNSLSNI